MFIAQNYNLEEDLTDIIKEGMKDKFSIVEKELGEKYGLNSVIDLATGEVKDKEEAKEQSKE